MTNIWPRNARFLFSVLPTSVCLLTLGKGHRDQVTGSCRLASIPPWKVCQCEDRKARFMGLEMSRCRAAWLSFHRAKTSGKKRAVLHFLTLFMYLHSWVKTTGKIQKTSPAIPPLLSSPPFIQRVTGDCWVGCLLVGAALGSRSALVPANLKISFVFIHMHCAQLISH